MKSELTMNGPISCSIEATDELVEQYKGGIWRQYLPKVEVNHDIAVVGWGKDD